MYCCCFRADLQPFLVRSTPVDISLLVHWPHLHKDPQPGTPRGLWWVFSGFLLFLERQRFILLFLYGRKMESGLLQECLYPSRSAFSLRIIVKNPPANAGDSKDPGSIPGWGRSPGEGNDNPFQYSCWENSMDRRTWWAAAHEVTKNQT